MPIVIGDFSPPPELVLLELVLLLELPHAAISGTSPTRSAAMADLRKIFITSPRLDVSIARCASRDPIDGEPNGEPRATTSPHHLTAIVCTTLVRGSAAVKLQTFAIG